MRLTAFLSGWLVLLSPCLRTLEDVYAEGLLLSPTSRTPVADVVALPDADHIPEQLVGLKEGIPPESQYARRLAESGCRVLVPMLINRQSAVRGREDWDGPQRQYAMQLIQGLEPKPTLALVDSSKGSTPFAAQETLGRFCDHLSLDAFSVASGSLPERLVADFSAADRHARQMHQLDLHCRHLLRESEYVRERFLERLDYSSVEAFDKSAEPYREHFRRKILEQAAR